jgi:ketosteroid isomerase-like protein
MRSLILAFCALACSFPMLAQGTDANLSSELVALHAKWMQAYYNGESATMNQFEADNLTLIMPTGFVWHKSGPRTDEQTAHEPETETALSDVSVRQFGDAAILTGTLHTKSAKVNSDEATTVVFVRSSGKWKIASAQWTTVASTK